MSDAVQAVSRVINLATRLRALAEKRTKDAEFKGIIDDILLELAEVQLTVEQLVTEAVRGAPQQPQLCPRCGELGWKATGTRPHKSGRMAQIYACPKCGLKEEVLPPA
jgi:predicted RNA-binding Zn-ribbon protein involved in translation (DUF1610 family)